MHTGTTNLFHPLLFEPHYWQARLARLDGRTRRMLLVPRPDLGSNGLEVLELLLRSHDDLRLRGIMAHHPIAGPPAKVRLYWPRSEHFESLDLDSVSPSMAHLYLIRDPDRRLEDRVLDFLCLLCAAKGLPALEGTCPEVELAEPTNAPDEYRIGRILLDRGWCEAIEIESEDNGQK